jgi:hypothetical protein
MFFAGLADCSQAGHAHVAAAPQNLSRTLLPHPSVCVLCTVHCLRRCLRFDDQFILAGGQEGLTLFDYESVRLSVFSDG